MYTFLGWCIVITIIYFVNPFRNFSKWKEERNKETAGNREGNNQIGNLSATEPERHPKSEEE